MGSERWIALPPERPKKGKEKKGKERRNWGKEKRRAKSKKKRDLDRNLHSIIIKKLSSLRAIRASSRELSPSIPETVSNFVLRLHNLVISQGN